MYNTIYWNPQLTIFPGQNNITCVWNCHPTLPGENYDNSENVVVAFAAHVVSEQVKKENTFQLDVENQAPSKINQIPIKNKTKNQNVQNKSGYDTHPKKNIVKRYKID